MTLVALCLNQASAVELFAEEPQDAPPSNPTPTQAADQADASAVPQASGSSTGGAAPSEQTGTKQPSDELLNKAGARIGRIEISVEDIFDPNNPKENGWVYRAANSLHITSRDSTIRAQLLFKSGDAYDRRKLDETARNLRARRYLNEATVVPVYYHPEDNTVDVLVRVHDVWTLNVGASYGRTGGANHSGFQLEEGNFLGFGKDVSIERDYEVDRRVWNFGYSDPNLFNSRWELDTAYATASDGGTHAFTLDHPFFSLDSRWYAQIDGLNKREVERRYDLGSEVDRYRSLHETYGAGVGWSTGLRDGWVQRFSTGYRSDLYRYSPDDNLTVLPLPESYHFVYPWVQYDLLEDHYEVERNRDQVGRTEDVYYGRSLSVQIGDSSHVFGADRNAWLVQFTGRDAWHLSQRQSVFVAAKLSGRYESSQLRGTLLTTMVRYDFRRSRKNLFTTSLVSDYGWHLDPSQVLYLGGDTSDDSNAASSSVINLSSSGGLRGYPLHYRSGTRRNVLTIEQRYYTDWQILRLLTVGGAAFIDVGQISGGDPMLSDGSGVLSDIGFGLRLGNVRSSRGEVFHIEVAYPLNHVPGISKLQFLVVTKHSF